jgi:uncharacterized protein with LGFP repeats
VNGQRGHLRKLVGRALVSLATTALAVVLLAPNAAASPIGDAESAIMSAWEKAGGDTSPLGARKGDVYPVGDGFALDFTGGKMFYTTDTGAKFVYGPILDKYESLGGPAGSDLGFPTINDIPGLAGPDSRVATFSASDKPVIFWTADHGAFVVRGPLNAAWDKLGSSGGVLGAPVGDETYDGDVTSQKFSGGAVSWNRKTKEFTAEPAVLAEQLKGFQAAVDPTAAINMAWRASGGANGPLGVKQGDEHPMGGDGIAQDFVGGKVFFSPATGANAVESDILAKYESLGGPVGSDLGFPIANESDGGIAPSSRICTFSAADKPVIFWTPDHGAYVVRGAMKAAWDKLKGPTGKLGAPVGDQAVDGDVISQKFMGGKISWNRAKNTFTTDPANLAPLLSGLQVSGQNQPSASAMPPHANKFTWHWWWLVVALAVLLLIAMLVLGAFTWRRRHSRPASAAYDPGQDVDDGYDADVGYETAADGHWPHDDVDFGADQAPHGEVQPPEDLAPDAGSAPFVSWLSGGGAAGAGPDEDVPPAGAYGSDILSGSDEGAGQFGYEEEDPDAVDTTPTRIVSDGDLPHPGFSEAAPSDAAGPDTAYPDQAALDAAYLDGAYPEAGYPEAGYPEAGYADAAAPDAAYPNEVAPDAAYPDAEFAEAASDAAHPDHEFAEAAADAAASDTVFADATSGAEARAGRHAAADAADATDTDAMDMGSKAAATPPPVALGSSSATRPTIHLPLDDPYQVPDGYPIKASARFGLYYTPNSALYHDTLAEVWLASEEVALANGFIKAD